LDLHANTCKTFEECSTYNDNGFVVTLSLLVDLVSVESTFGGDIQVSNSSFYGKLNPVRCDFRVVVGRILHDETHVAAASRVLLRET
jgi:hypothetical protein